MGVALCSASLIGVMDLTSANCRRIAIRQAKRRCLFQRVEESVGAAEVNHAIHDEWRRKNSADTDLLIVGYNRSFTPVGVIEKGDIDPTHAPFSWARSTITFRSSSGMCVVPSHRPLIASSPRHGKVAAKMTIASNRGSAPGTVINLAAANCLIAAAV